LSQNLKVDYRPKSLANLAADDLRKRIINGEIALGQKITEREVGELLGIGRIPAREALMALEHEGLIVSNSESRSVLLLEEKDLSGLYRVRAMLEEMAATSAAAYTSPERALALEGRLNSLRFGCERQDSSITTPADLALHEEIWAQANDKYLERCLRSIRGVVFVLVMRGSSYGKRNWELLYETHRALVEAINSGDSKRSAHVMRSSLSDASKHSLKVEKILSTELRT
jgi:DNA-binding GntR family transcriptional regulator